MADIETYCRAELAKLQDMGRLREFRPLTNLDGAWIEVGGEKMLNLSSNDYLGLGGDDELRRRFYQEFCGADSPPAAYACGSTSSRLLTGDNPVVHQLEEELARAFGAEAALVFNSGYHINIGILPALYGRGDLILSDKLNHASIVDGTQLSRAVTRRYRHLDYEHLRSLLEKERGKAKRAVIVSESVFSMDGDTADIEKLVQLKKEFDAELYLDEAHSFGLHGVQGLGKAAAAGRAGEVDYLIGVFGKALASMGSFVVCREVVKKFLVNTARSLIFTTALPPVVTAWNLFIFRHILGLDQQRRKLQDLGEKMRQSLAARNLRTDGSTNIVPVFIGDDDMAVKFAQRMRDAGYYILPIRPPTVPAGTSRFRLSLTAGMEWEELAPLAELIAREMRQP